MPRTSRPSSAKRSCDSSCARSSSATTTSPSATPYRSPPAVNQAVRYCVHRIKALRKAIRNVFGEALVQRCRWHTQRARPISPSAAPALDVALGAVRRSEAAFPTDRRRCVRAVAQPWTHATRRASRRRTFPHRQGARVLRSEARLRPRSLIRGRRGERALRRHRFASASLVEDCRTSPRRRRTGRSRER